MNKWLSGVVIACGFAHSLCAESFTTNIIDGFATNITSEFILGDTGPYNFLLITNAGRMTNHSRSFIGNTVEAHNNVAIIAGTGSVWHASEAAYLGLRSPSNTLAILDGAGVRALQAVALGS
jgi:T5SS/PEP-CTERM-associated repeat protein